MEPGDLVLAEANAYKRKRKVKDQWEEEPYEVVCQVAESIPLYLMKNNCVQDALVFSTKTDFFSSLLQRAVPLCMVIQAEQARCATTALEKQTLDRSETEKVPQSVDCLPLAQ